MSRISFLMLPEPGHLLPTMRMAESLKTAGHSICYLATPQFRRFILMHGFEFNALWREVATSTECEDVFADNESGDTLRRKVPDRQAARDSMIDALLATKPDLVVCDSLIGTYHGDYLANRVPVNVVMCGTSLPQTNNPPFPEIVLCPKELEIPDALLQHPLRQYAESSVFTNRVTYSFPWHVIDGKKPLVYCTLGTQLSEYRDAAGVFQSIIAAFDQLPGCQLLLVAGSAYESIAGVKTPPNVIVVRSAPQLELLKRAAVAITHGGLGTLKEAILAQVPMIVIPFLHDQPANGKRVEHHGLGYVCSPEECSPRHIELLISKLLADEAVRAKMGAMSNIFWRYESEDLACESVCSLLAPLEMPVMPLSTQIHFAEEEEVAVNA